MKGVAPMSFGFRLAFRAQTETSKTRPRQQSPAHRCPEPRLAASYINGMAAEVLNLATLPSSGVARWNPLLSKSACSAHCDH